MPPKNSRKSSFFSIPVLPGQRRQRHDPSRSFPVDLRCQHGSTRFTQVGLPFPVLQGSPRWFFYMSKTTGKTPGSSRSSRHHPGPSRWHYGSTPGTPRFTPEPGSTGSPVGLGRWHCNCGYRSKEPRRDIGVESSFRTTKYAVKRIGHYYNSTLTVASCC